MNLTDLPQEILEAMPPIEHPSVPHYFVTLKVNGEQGIVSDTYARQVFGDDWDLVLVGKHPIIEAERLEITLH